MARASKQRPWVVEMYAATIDKWVEVDAYRDEDAAKANAELARKRAPETDWRVVKRAA